MFSLKSLSAIALIAVFGLAACQKNDPFSANDQIENEEDEIILNSEFGNFDTSNEAPGFGDPELLAKSGEDIDAGDELANDADVQQALNGDSVPTYFVRLNWGHLEGDSTESETTDWSGSIEVNKGVLVALKTLQFEQGDYIVRPRDNRQKIDYVSVTRPHRDGLALAIINNDTTSTEGTLTINAGAYTRTFSFTELDSLDLIETVDEKGNEISITSRLKDVHRAHGGFFMGQWIRRSMNSGELKGRWISNDGLTTGYMLGFWGRSNRGTKAFAAKVISDTGEFIALLAGEWRYRNNAQNHGTMSGRWVNRNMQEVGSFHGVWHAGAPGDSKGYFSGRWHQKG